MVSPLARRVGRAIHSGALWADADRVAVALSGGADSVALLELLSELAPRARWRLAGVIHVHHGLRAQAADADAAFCRDLAARFGLPCEQLDVNVPAERAQRGGSLESVARQLRYAAFVEAARRLGATIVATGHTLDDQAETVLLRLFRGAALRGVAAIRPRRGHVARPLLGCRRAELRAYLAARGTGWREDASNEDRAIPRNRLRLDVLPPIEAAWPGAPAALARFARAAHDDEAWLEAQAAVAAAEVIRPATNGVELIRERLASLPLPIARRVVRRAIEAAGGAPTFGELDRVLRVGGGGRDGARLALHGVAVEIAGPTLRIGRPTNPRKPTEWEHRLEVPGKVRLGETGDLIRASIQEGATRPALSPGWDAVAALQATAVMLPLTVRSRRHGDRFTPLGAPGSRRLQDLFVDRKIRRDERARVPVVEDAAGRIVWVAGVAVAEFCRVQVPESGMVILEFKKDTP